MKIIETYRRNTAAETIEIISAHYLRDYKINFLFSDGCQKLVNFEAFLLKTIHPSIAKYRDKNLFKEFVLEEGNLNWNDYDMIFPIADLHSGEIK